MSTFHVGSQGSVWVRYRALPMGRDFQNAGALCERTINFGDRTQPVGAMLNAMTSIEDFLLVRIAEDEQALEALTGPLRSRMMDHLTAVRRAVAIRQAANKARPRGAIGSDGERVLWDMLTVLALPYVDHPDYTSSFQPRQRLAVEPAPNTPFTLRPLEGRIARSEPEQKAYVDVAISLAQAVAARDPDTPEQWVDDSIRVIGSAWSNEMSTEVILSRALLAMTRLAVAEAEQIASGKSGRTPSKVEVAATLASMSQSPKTP